MDNKTAKEKEVKVIIVSEIFECEKCSQRISVGYMRTWVDIEVNEKKISHEQAIDNCYKNLRKSSSKTIICEDYPPKCPKCGAEKKYLKFISRIF